MSRKLADRPKADASRTAGIPVGGSEPDDLVRAAWLYYVAGHTQERTARVLGISRVKAARLLAEARETGIVKISIEHRLSAMVEVEEQLRQRFNLSFCRVTPPLSTLTASPRQTRHAAARSPGMAEVESELARRAVGMTAARYLRERLLVNERPVVGLAWGRTTASMIDQLSGVRKPGAIFVSTMGSLTMNSAANLFDVVHRAAEKTGGEGHFLPVPYIANSVADRDVLMAQRSVQDALGLAARADFFFMSMGECDQNGFLFKNGFLSARELKDLHSAGAVGDAMGKFFDQEGKLVNSDLNHRSLALDMQHMQGRDVVLLCGGRTKARAARGILRAGFVNGLVIDGDAAMEVCEQEGE